MQCLHLANDSLNAQTQTDMLTRIFWISVSLLESDYEHEFLLAIELLDKVCCGVCKRQIYFFIFLLTKNAKFIKLETLQNLQYSSHCRIYNTPKSDKNNKKYK